MKKIIMIAIAAGIVIAISFQIGRNYQAWQDVLKAAEKLDTENFKKLYGT